MYCFKTLLLHVCDNKTTGKYQVYEVHYVTEDSQVFSSVTAKVYPKLQNNELLVVVTLTQIICFLLRSIMQNKTLPVSVFLI